MRRHGLSIALVRLAAVVMLFACTTPEAKMRSQIAGTYITDIQQTAGGQRIHEYEVLTLTAEGRWKRNGWVQVGNRRHEGRADFGTYRIQGVTLNLRSLVEEGMPYRYTISGDTLFTSNASFLYAVTGLDIGERVMVRER
jgi:hypothetical protein